MKRKEFIKKLVIGTAAVAVAGPAIIEAAKEIKYIVGVDPIDGSWADKCDIIYMNINGKTYWYRKSMLDTVIKFQKKMEEDFFEKIMYSRPDEYFDIKLHDATKNLL